MDDLIYKLTATRQANTNTRIIFISISPSTMREWCIQLNLVRYGFKSLTLLADGFILVIKRYDGKSHGRGSTGYYYESNNQGRLEVDTNYLDDWLAFYLGLIQGIWDETLGKNFNHHIDQQFYASEHAKKSKLLYLTLDINVNE